MLKLIQIIVFWEIHTHPEFNDPQKVRQGQEKLGNCEMLRKQEERRSTPQQLNWLIGERL